MRRGEVWWARLPGPAGSRPVVLLSRNEAYLVRDLVTIAPVTTRVRRIPTEVPLGPDAGLPKRCVANLDAITTMSGRAGCSAGAGSRPLRHPPGRRIGPREWFTSGRRWHEVAERGEEPVDPDAHHLAAVIRRAHEIGERVGLGGRGGGGGADR